MLCLELQTQVICGNKLTQPFVIQASVKQGCMLSLLDWIMTNATKGQGGIRWALSYMLSDLVCLLAHRHTDMQAMTVDMISTAAIVGLEVRTKKPST